MSVCVNLSRETPLRMLQSGWLNEFILQRAVPRSAQEVSAKPEVKGHPYRQLLCYFIVYKCKHVLDIRLWALNFVRHVVHIPGLDCSFTYLNLLWPCACRHLMKPLQSWIHWTKTRTKTAHLSCSCLETTSQWVTNKVILTYKIVFSETVECWFYTLYYNHLYLLCKI